MTNWGNIKAFFLFVFSFFMLLPVSSSDFDNTIIKINPEFKLKRSSNGIVILSSIKNGTESKYEFSDLYADILLAAYRKQRLSYILKTVIKKYAYSEEDGRREIKHAINVLRNWNMIIIEPQMASLN